jgi:nucleoside-diphosphate-sugar epimerase
VQFATGDRDYVPSGSISLVDVRDVALAHILAAENDKATGRFLLVADIPKWSDVLDVVRSSVGEPWESKVAKGAPDAATEAPWRYNLLKRFTVDTTKASTELGLKFRGTAEMVKDLCENRVFRALLPK